MNFKIMVDKKSFVLTIINLIFIVSLLFFFFQFKSEDFSFTSPEYIIFPWIIISLILHIINFKIRKYNLYEFGMWFIILSYFFLFGLTFREVFKLNFSLLWNPIVYYSEIELFNSYFFSLIALNFFGIGYFITKKNKKFFNTSINVSKNKMNQMFYFGILLVLVGGVCMLINDVQAINIMKSYNSYIGFKYVNQSGLLDDLAFLFLPGVFLLLFSGKMSSRQKKYLFLIIVLYFVIVMMLTGSRKIKLFSLISLFLGYIFSCKDQEKKSIHLTEIKHLK